MESIYEELCKTIDEWKKTMELSRQTMKGYEERITQCEEMINLQKRMIKRLEDELEENTEIFIKIIEEDLGRPLIRIKEIVDEVVKKRENEEIIKSEE